MERLLRERGRVLCAPSVGDAPVAMCGDGASIDEVGVRIPA